LIVAAIVVGSSLLLSSHAGPHWEGLPLLGLIAFAIAAALGIAWAIVALRSGKL
jgi:ubiquinone biosynthesis protein